MPPSQASILKTDMPNATKMRSMEAEEDIEVIEEEKMVTEETSLHGVANPTEAAKHVHLLDQALENMDAKIKLEDQRCNEGGNRALQGNHHEGGTPSSGSKC